MIDRTIADYFGIRADCVPRQRLDEFGRLMSQTTMQERETAYALARYVFSGQGEIFDVGSAAGGSSYCFAAGVLDSELSNKTRRVIALDKFGGYSIKAFRTHLPSELNVVNDMDLFRHQTLAVTEALEPVAIDLDEDFAQFRLNTEIEIAHIDAAKTPKTWRGIAARLLNTICPGKTIWIFQDFVRIRLPWHAYSIAELQPFGSLIGGSEIGTLYFRFNKSVSPEVIDRVSQDTFTLEERLYNVEQTFATVKERFNHIFGEHLSVDDLAVGTLSYCHFWFGDKERAKAIFQSTSSDFRDLAAVQQYKQELGLFQ